MRFVIPAILLSLAAANASDHWAFQPLAPASHSQIDDHILDRLNTEKLTPNPPASQRDLLRRTHFQLTGLPPSPQQTAAFLDDTDPEKFPKLVDNLIASRHFGERWGRHWLDLARYADSNGLDENFLFREAWRYRNNVIDAVNSDTPLDRFILEQLAGDLLPHDTTTQRDRQRIAAGFLTLGPKVLLGNNAENQKMEVADEQLDTIGKAFLGLTLGCARCHDHKFDPIPTADYYAMAGILTSTEVMETRYMLGQQRKMEQLVGLGDDGKNLDTAYETYWREHKKLQDEVKQAKQEKRPGLAELENKLANPPPIPPRAMVPSDKNKPTPEPIRQAGQYNKPTGNPVPRGFIQILNRGTPPTIPEQSSGRIELATWLTDTENGAGHLTARVLANRVWHHLIGRGLVRTTDNFGLTGEKPTHPKLLDHLARQLIDSGWSLKSLVRQITLTQAFALASTHSETAHATDPDNTLLWRGHRRRLDPESLRDAMLSVSGQLDLNPVGSTVNYLGDQATAVGTNENRRRTDFRCRSVYLPVIRNDLPEIFQAFDFADAHTTTGARPRTTVPTQTLFLLNDQSVLDAADALAGHLEPLPDDNTRIGRLFQLLFNTPPTETERNDLLAFLQSHQPESGAWPAAAHAMLSTSRFQFID